MKFKSSLPLGLALCLALASPLVAAESPDAAYRLGEVVVSAPQAGVEAAGTVHTVTAAEIQARGARTLDEALALVPGLLVRTAAEGTPRIDLRGFRTRHVTLLLDGIPINSTFDGQFDPSTFGVENIAAIKVTTGGGSVLYGEGGNGGVINIITKKGQKGLHGSLGGETAGNGTYLGRFTLGGATDTVDAFVSGSAYDRNSYHLSGNFNPTAGEDGGGRLNSDRTRKNLFANLGWAPTTRTQLAASLQYRKDKYGIPPVDNIDSTDPFSKKKAKFERIDDLQGVATQLAFDQQLPGAFSSRGWVYFNRLTMLDNYYDDATFSTQAANGASRSDSATDSAGVNLQLKGDWQSYGVTTLALLADNSTWNAHGFEVQKNVASNFDLQRDLQLYTAALQYELQPLPKLGLVLGAGGHLQRRDNGKTDHAGSYMIGLSYDLASGTRLHASHSRKVRFPSISQLYDVTSGNDELKVEHSLHYEAGVDQQLPAATTLGVTGFLTDASNFIEKNDTTNRYENYEKYRFAGAEFSVENRAVKHLLLRGSYSYLYSRDRSAETGKHQLQYRPRDKFTFEGRYVCPFGLTADASLLYVARQYFYDSTGTLKKRLNDYTVVNVKLAQDLWAKRLNLYAGIDNLLDEDYEQSYGLPQAGRTYYGGAEIRF